MNWTPLSGGAGTISNSDLYTAPASITSQQTVTVQATSAANSAQTATAVITLTPPAVSAFGGAPSTNAFTGCYFNDMTLGLPAVSPSRGLTRRSTSTGTTIPPAGI